MFSFLQIMELQKYNKIKYTLYKTKKKNLK